MMGDYHVRFRERFGVKLPLPTRLPFATQTISRSAPKIYASNTSQLIKSCFTRTVPAAKTKSIGLQADAQVVIACPACGGFCIAILTILSLRDNSVPVIGTQSSGQLYLDKETCVHLLGPKSNET